MKSGAGLGRRERGECNIMKPCMIDDRLGVVDAHAHRRAQRSAAQGNDEAYGIVGVDALDGIIFRIGEYAAAGASQRIVK